SNTTRIFANASTRLAYASAPAACDIGTNEDRDLEHQLHPPPPPACARMARQEPARRLMSPGNQSAGSRIPRRRISRREIPSLLPRHEGLQRRGHAEP